jgi:hypothetical protein
VPSIDAALHWDLLPRRPSRFHRGRDRCESSPGVLGVVVVMFPRIGECLRYPRGSGATSPENGWGAAQYTRDDDVQQQPMTTMETTLAVECVEVPLIVNAQYCCQTLFR